MNPIGYARDYLRFCRQYRAFLRDTISLAEAQSIVKDRLARRGDNFLSMVKRHVFSSPRSPYRQLMQAARCEFGDLERLVSKEGLEDTLLTLRREGVYIGFEEYKGRKPLVRDGREIPIGADAFRNRYLSGMLEGSTGGSTGVPRRVAVHVDHLAAQSPARMLSFEAHGIRTQPHAIWMGILPDASGPNVILRPAKHGLVPERWFANIVTPRQPIERVKARLMNRTIVLLGRLSGVPIPEPEPLRLDQAIVVAEWLAETLKTRGPCSFLAHVSKGVRVAVAATNAGLDLTGATFVLAGEPVTPGKVASVAASGAVTVPMYAFAEHGELGVGCVNPIGEDEVHLFEDTLAVVQASRQVPGYDVQVDSFHWTSLSPTAPNILLNVESDDYGIIEERECGCPLHAYGFRKVMREIRSFRKMTGEGVTLIGSDAVRALEEVLPDRFGGSPLDYQLIEEEDERGMTVISLVIDPSVPIERERDVLEAFVQAAGDSGMVWDGGDSLRIKRQKPVLTRAGKLMPLHLSRKAGA